MGWINADDMLVQGTLGLLALIDGTPSERHMKWVTGGTGIANHDTVIRLANNPVCSAVVAEGLCDGRYWHLIEQKGIFFRNVAWRRIDVEKNFRALKYAGDWNLWRNMAKTTQLYQVDRPLAISRIGEDKVSRQLRKEFQEEVAGFVSHSQRLSSLRRLAAQSKLERNVLNFEFPTGKLSFARQKLNKEAAHWLSRRIGPSHDADWQFPAETERHAYRRILASLPARDDMVYFAFPWATLIDQIDNGTVAKSTLLESLQKLAKSIQGAQCVVTVCQHIRMLAHRKLFEQAGITHIFWTHATKGLSVWPGKKRISITPFPLFPVQFKPETQDEPSDQRKHLFTFVGARSNSWYLSEARTWIIENLHDDPRGIVIGRDDWHYNKIVYDHQIRKVEGGSKDLVNNDASKEFSDYLSNSLFALCPSGSGPNSIRLWEAIGAGTIPVIIADSYAPPGPRALWEEAAVFCDETEAAVKELPDRLEELAQNQEMLARKRKALRQIWSLYGPENFTHDITKLFLMHPPAPVAKPSDANATPPGDGPIKVCLFGRHCRRTPLSYPSYQPLFGDRIKFVRDLESADFVVTGFDLDFRENNPRLRRAVEAKPDLKFAVISEEPLWDTVWSTQRKGKTGKFTSGDRELEFALLNHFNADLFQFQKIPYFLTTDDEYFARYGAMFSRNAEMSPSDVLDMWQQARYDVAFMVEKRTDPRYGMKDTDAIGLSVFRSELAQAMDNERALVSGKGWKDDGARQALPDWHLDKLNSLNRRCKMVSAIENTHQKHYLTEKIFDAFAVGSIPIYFADKDHDIHKVVSGGFVNIHGSTVEEAASLIRAFVPDEKFARAWLDQQSKLAARFLDAVSLRQERQRVASRVLSFLADEKSKALASKKDIKVEPKNKKIVEKIAQKSAEKDEPVIDAPRSSGDVMTFSTATVVENFKDGDRYEHINIKMDNVLLRKHALNTIYVILQRISGSNFGLKLAASDISPPGTGLLQDAEGTSLASINLFVSPNAEEDPFSWDRSPGDETRAFMLSLARAVSSIIDSPDPKTQAADLADWQDASNSLMTAIER